MQLSEIEKILGGQRVLHMRIQKRKDLIALKIRGTLVQREITKDIKLDMG